MSVTNRPSCAGSWRNLDSPLSKVMSKAITDEGRSNWIYAVGTVVGFAVMYAGVYFLQYAPAGWERGPLAGVGGIVLVVAVLLYVGCYSTGRSSIASPGKA
ncbi:MAG TPA: hypothetical protein VME67_11630 [Mycobacterium sp.]|nr:hypothetical protein [Mycobacterium sp.]HTX95436.1 hypothetical protein [Mycobacterium sp.]